MRCTRELTSGFQAVAAAQKAGALLKEEGSGSVPFFRGSIDSPLSPLDVMCCASDRTGPPSKAVEVIEGSLHPTGLTEMAVAGLAVLSSQLPSRQEIL